MDQGQTDSIVDVIQKMLHSKILSDMVKQNVQNLERKVVKNLSGHSPVVRNRSMLIFASSLRASFCSIIFQIIMDKVKQTLKWAKSAVSNKSMIALNINLIHIFFMITS